MAATKTARPGRTLAVFCLVIAVLYGLVAMGSSWKPGLGLDLQGGTEIAMEAENTQGGSIPRESIEEARNIIDQRVNGSGVASARVTTEGGDVIQVSIPGEGQVQKELAERVRQTAKLRFRLVACSTSAPGQCATAMGGGATTPQAPSGTTPQAPSGTTGGTGGALPRSGVAFEDPTPSGAATAEPQQDGSSTPAPSGSASADPSASPSGGSSEDGATGGKTSDQDVIPVEQAVKFMNTLTLKDGDDPSQWASKFAGFTCPAPGEPVEDVPGQPLLTCDDTGTETYLLTPAIIEGTQISDANYGIPQNAASYAVFLDFHKQGNDAFADATGAIASTGQLFAITLDGQVISAATADQRISGGAQITGGFTQETAQALSNNLKYGSLPLDFPEENIQTRTIGPSLAGDQLSAGLWAGLVGLILVLIFSVLYYRGMSVVVIGSLLVAGALTYALIVLLSETAGVTLDLPGVAGLIVGVGITADSFIILYERMRDEMREGRSMRVAVDAAWVRARNTCLASDAVSFLAALVLYIFATNEVRGFAFMLGLTTLIDVVVFFWFTHPMTKLFSRLRFFNRGHRLSGLDKNAIGIDTPALAGGKA